MSVAPRGGYPNMRASSLVDHPAREAHQKIFEALQVLRRESVLDVRPFQHSLKTSEPHFPRTLVDFKRKVPGAHPRRAVLLDVDWRSAEQSNEERGRLA